jgi:hypothetical protein
LRKVGRALVELLIIAIGVGIVWLLLVSDSGH